MEKVVLGLGSNLGRRLNNLKKAVNLLYKMPGFDILAFSSVYETEPWGFKNQNNFLNCAIAGLYRYSAESLFEEVKFIEHKAGRISRDRWHPREIDIDILFYGSRIIRSGKLEIPHPQIKFRNFVLMPLEEIMPGFLHPVFRKEIRELFNKSNDDCRVVKINERLNR